MRKIAFITAVAVTITVLIPSIYQPKAHICCPCGGSASLINPPDLPKNKGGKEGENDEDEGDNNNNNDNDLNSCSCSCHH